MGWKFLRSRLDATVVGAAGIERGLAGRVLYALVGGEGAEKLVAEVEQGRCLVETIAVGLFVAGFDSYQFYVGQGRPVDPRESNRRRESAYSLGPGERVRIYDRPVSFGAEVRIADMHIM